MNADIIAIDAGNTRIKWAQLHDGLWTESGTIATVDACQLHEAAEDWPRNAQIQICNVAGPKVAGQMTAQLAHLGFRPAWLTATAFACAVHNHYRQPERLGADRWAALIGAWARIGEPCLVVSAGTATTIDFLDLGGVFRGGVILPGLRLMIESLHVNTAQLPAAAGQYVDFPRNTDDAITSGCLQAQAGAIERMHRQLPRQAPVLLTGGNAMALQPLLDSLPVVLDERLVLTGLCRVADAATTLPPPSRPDV